MPSGHAYTKAFRTCKTCVGTEFCRYGVGDSTTLGIADRASASRASSSPAKLKLADGRLPAQLLGGDDQGRRRRRDRGRQLGDLRRRRRRRARAQGRPARAPWTRTRRCCCYTGRFMQYYREHAKYLERTYDFVERIGIERAAQHPGGRRGGICARAGRGDAGRRRRLRRSVAGGRRAGASRAVRRRAGAGVAAWRAGMSRPRAAVPPRAARVTTTWARSTAFRPARGRRSGRRARDRRVPRARRDELYATQARCPHQAGRSPTASSATAR